MSFEFRSPEGHLLFDKDTPMLAVKSLSNQNYLASWRSRFSAFHGTTGNLFHPFKGFDRIEAYSRLGVYSLTQGGDAPSAGRKGFEFYSEDGTRLLSSSAPLPQIVGIYHLKLGDPNGDGSFTYTVPSGRIYAILPLALNFRTVTYPSGLGGWEGESTSWEPRLTGNSISISPVKLSQYYHPYNPLPVIGGNLLFALMDVSGV